MSGVEGAGDRGIDFGMSSAPREDRNFENSLDTWRRVERKGGRGQTGGHAHVLCKGGGGGCGVGDREMVSMARGSPSQGGSNMWYGHQQPVCQIHALIRD